MTALVARLSAAMAALVVLLGLVATPPKAPEAAAIATISIADVQLDAAAAATPTINDIIELAALIAATPLWYAALPITLPASIALGVGFSLVLNIIRGNYSADLVLSAVVGVGVSSSAPVADLVETVSIPAVGGSTCPSSASADRRRAIAPGIG